MEQWQHHEREIWFLISFLVVFFVLFVIGFVNLQRGIPVFGIGLPYNAENLIVLVVSCIAMLKVIWHLATG